MYTWYKVRDRSREIDENSLLWERIIAAAYILIFYTYTKYHIRVCCSGVSLCVCCLPLLCVVEPLGTRGVPSIVDGGGCVHPQCLNLL